VKSVNEPATPALQEGETPQWPYVGVDPLHPLNTPVSANEPPGSDITGGGGEGGTPNPDVAPEIEGLEPDEAEVGSADVVMAVHGTGFTVESVIQFDIGDLATTFVSPTEISATIKPSEWGDGVVPVRVKNGDGGLKSEPVEFEFTPAGVPEASRQTKRTQPKKTKKKGR